ncbi:MFS transporter [Micromonospora sp. NPDC003197]
MTGKPDGPATVAAGGYAALLARPEGRRLALAAVGARLPQSMIGISILFLLANQEDVRVAGALVAAYTLGFGMVAPLSGRLVDRLGARRVIRVGMALFLVAAGLLVLAATRSAPVPLTVACAAVTGASMPPLGPAVRAHWLGLPETYRRAGVALDAVLLDVCLIVGPVVASALVAVRPYLGVLAIVVITGLGAYLLLSVLRALPARADEPTGQPGPGWWGPLRSVAYRRLLVVMVFASCAIAAVAVGLPAFAGVANARWAGGPLVAAFSVGSIVGGLLWGRRGRRSGRPAEGGPTPTRLPVVLGALVVALAVLPLAGGRPLVLLALAPLAGLPVAVVLATLAMAAGQRAPAGTAIEAQSWLVSANTLGSAAAALLTTSLLGQGHLIATLVAPAGLALVAALVALATGTTNSDRYG